MARRFSRWIRAGSIPFVETRDRAKQRAQLGTTRVKSSAKAPVTKAAPVTAPVLTAQEQKRHPLPVGCVIDCVMDPVTGIKRPRLLVAQWLDTLGKYSEPSESGYGASMMFSGGREPWFPAVVVSAAARALAHPMTEADTLGALLDALASGGCSAPEATLALRAKFDEQTRKAVRTARAAQEAAE